MTERSDFHFLQDASDFLRINEHILRLYKKIFFKERKSIKKNLLELRMTHIPRQQEASGCKAALGKAASPAQRPGTRVSLCPSELWETSSSSWPGPLASACSQTPFMQ